MKTTEPTLAQVGAQVAELSSNLSAFLKDVGHPEPSLKPTSPDALPPTPGVQMTRLRLQEQLITMLHLVTGPTEFWTTNCFSWIQDPLTIHVLNHFNFWDAVPLDGSASYAEIAQATDLPEPIVRRYLQSAFANFVFADAGPHTNRVVHTAASAFVAPDEAIRAHIGHSMDTMWPASTVGVEALEKWFVGKRADELPDDIHRCAFVLASNDGKQRGVDAWTFLETSERPGQPKGFRAARFAKAMQALTKTMGENVESVIEMMDWDRQVKGTVVDMGGSAGHISALIAHKYPDLKVIVQDLPHIEAGFHANMKAENLTSRVSFQVHDITKPQTQPADIFLVKSVLHDWPDRVAAEILRSLLPVLKAGNRVVVFDIILPPAFDESGARVAPLGVRKFMASVDLSMHVCTNAKERTVEDWTAVMNQADGRFELEKVHIVPGAPLGIMSFVFKG